MSKVMINSLIDEINSLLSRPVGSVTKRAPVDIVHPRDQLKQLRSHLEIFADDIYLNDLDQQYQPLVTHLQEKIYTNRQPTYDISAESKKMEIVSKTDKSKTDKLDTMPPTAIKPAVSNIFGAESDLIMETSTMTNAPIDPSSTFVNDRLIASLQQAIQQTLQQVVKESVQQSVQQVVSQTLAVERALMVGEISASLNQNLNKIVESQQRSQISQELITLTQQKQKLNAEISQLESDRATWMRQFQEFQSAQQESIDRSLQSSLQSVNQTLTQTLQQNLVNLSTVKTNSVVSPPKEEEFVGKVQEQTDRFLSHLDEMFSSTFRSLEQDVQAYQTSLEAKLGYMESLEQKGEALINNLVDRISQQNEQQSNNLAAQAVEIDTFPELPDDIPSRYLEIISEPVDENLINALLAGNEFGESIVEVTTIDVPTNLSETEDNNEEFLNATLDQNLDLEDYTENSDIFHSQPQNDDLEHSSASSLVEIDQEAEKSSSLNISELEPTELESILGASSDTLFEDSTDSPNKQFGSHVDLYDLALSDLNIIEDPQSAIAARELNPDFDIEAATQIVEKFNFERSDISGGRDILESNILEIDLPEIDLPEIVEIDLQSLDFPLEPFNESGDEAYKPELLQWLEESSNRPNPTNIAEVSADEELLSWLGNEAIDMAKLSTSQNEPSAQISNRLISNPAVFDTPENDHISLLEPDLDSADHSVDKRQENQVENGNKNKVEHFFNYSTSDQADDSDESLILLSNMSINDAEFPEWEDSLLNELNSDLERLDAGVGTDRLIADNLDQFIRNTPYALTNWENEAPPTYPTIIEVTPNLEVPSIIEDPNSLFIDPSADTFSLSLNNSLQNIQSQRSSEQSEIVIDIANLQRSPFATTPNEIPEIFDNPESLFDAEDGDRIEDHREQQDLITTSNRSSNDDDMDDIFAVVIAENAAKYSQSTPFETSDELDQLFVRSPEQTISEISRVPEINSGVNSETGLDHESEIDTLFFGFDPDTEIEQVFNENRHENRSEESKTRASFANSTIDSDVRSLSEFDLLQQNLMQEDDQGFDAGAETVKEAIIFSEPIEFIEEELDTILQGFAQSKFADFFESSEATGFAVLEEIPTILEEPHQEKHQDRRNNVIPEDDWTMALEQLEAKLTQPFTQSFIRDDRQSEPSEGIDLSADEFFASLEYEKLNSFADKSAQATAPSPLANAIANLTDSHDSFVEEEDLLLNEFADAQDDKPDNDWDNLLNDLNSFNFNEPLLDDRRAQLGLSSVDSISDTSENVLDIDSLVIESSRMALIPPPPAKEVYSLDDTWILGVDFGSSAIRASLLNSDTGRVYALSIDDADEMPCKLVWTSEHSLDDPIAKDIRVLTKKAQSSGLEHGEVALGHFKQLLKLGLPYRGVSAWQPIMQWSDHHQASLRWLIAALKNLLEQIQTRANHPQLPDVGLILLKLSGVVFGYPSNWSDTYILNVREAILKSGLVSQSERVMAVEQAIAPVLSLLHDQKISKDITLVIDAGAVTTSLCLVKSLDLTAIDRSKLHIRSLDYAGISLSQDIIVQLFYPHWQLITNPNRHLCKFDHLTLPEIAASAPEQRILLQQYLLSSDIGQQMIELADRVKVNFSEDIGRDIGIDSWNEELMGQPIVVFRRELENLILQPFIQRLSRELNAIISNAGLLGEDVHQVLLLGNTMRIPLLSRWLAQKLPNASIDSLATSIVANGLALSPLYPNFHDVARQQYSDYFLLQEICRLNLTQAINPTQLLQQLQMRGINIKVCRDRILTMLQGDLPEGLFPWLEPEHAAILEDPTLSSDLFTGRLFELETDGTYQPNVTKFQQLRVYLQAIIGNMSQTLNEPLVFPEIRVHQGVS